jgi:hypothetical protein
MVQGYRWMFLLVLVQLGLLETLAGSVTKLRLELPEQDHVIDLSRDAGLRKLVSLADEMIQQSKASETDLHRFREKLLGGRAFADLSYGELKQYFSEPKDFISDKDRRGWKELRSLALKALDCTPEARATYYWQIQEIASAIENNHRSPSPPYMDMLQPPLYYMDYAHNPIAKGERRAGNLEMNRAVDASTQDPLPSTFWERPASVAKRDVYHGFGRANIPNFESKLWTYAAPKTSYGGCPGFEARSGDTRIKIKFAETTSEPFTARIFWALGYHVEPTDYLHALKLKYDRRFFREFHLRKDVQMKVRALFVPVHTVDLQQRYDPFDFIYIAVLRNGQRLSGRELKARLFHDPQREFPEDDPNNFQREFESTIDYLITTPANVQLREADVKSIGPWDFTSLDHAQRREVRAAGMLGAWVGWFDSRFENTRLKMVQRNGTTELRHYFTDLGGGLGKAVGVLSRHCECPNDFGWRFTRPPRALPLTTWRGEVREPRKIPFRIVDYQPIEDTEAFWEMTIDDARWMARLIAQLSEEQIVQALIASGFDATEVKIYTEKLLSRRDWMLRDLGLTTEFALLRPHGANMTLTYNPLRQPAPQVQLSGGSTITARPSLLVLDNGAIVPNTHTRTPLQRRAVEQVPSPAALSARRR